MQPARSLVREVLLLPGSRLSQGEPERGVGLRVRDQRTRPVASTQSWRTALDNVAANCSKAKGPTVLDAFAQLPGHWHSVRDISSRSLPKPLDWGNARPLGPKERDQHSANASTGNHSLCFIETVTRHSIHGTRSVRRPDSACRTKTKTPSRRKPSRGHR